MRFPGAIHLGLVTINFRQNASSVSVQSACRRRLGGDTKRDFLRNTRARAIGLDCLADRVLEVADTPLVAEKRVQRADGSVDITTGDAVDRSRLTVDSLKWYLCKLAPKKYGDKNRGD